MSRLLHNSALLIVDMQNGFCHPDGSFSKLTLPVSRHTAIVPAISLLRAWSHSHNIPVIFTRLEFDADYSDSGLVMADQPQLRKLSAFVRGTWDAAIVDELKPREGEYILSKTRNTALLQKLEVEQLLVTGVGTNVCVESTVRDAWTRGFRCLTVSDATATLSDEDHQASLRSMGWFGGTVSTGEIIDE
jgi:ureidoacrylate peracid hydrolase